MAIQYVSDEAGKPTAVLVPIDQWNKLASQHKEVSLLMQDRTEPKSKRKPSEFAGTLSKEEAEKFIKYVEQSRNEWERNF